MMFTVRDHGVEVGGRHVDHVVQHARLGHGIAVRAMAAGRRHGQAQDRPEGLDKKSPCEIALPRLVGCLVKACHETQAQVG